MYTCQNTNFLLEVDDSSINGIRNIFHTGNKPNLNYEKLPSYAITHSYVPTTYDYSHDLVYKAYQRKIGVTATFANETKFTINLMINKKIIKSKTLDELLSLIETYIRSFNEVNMVTMMHRIAIQCKDCKTKNKIKQDEWFKLLLESIVYRCNFSHRFSPKELANIVWSLVKIGINDHILFEIIGSESIVQLEGFVSINLSIILWSFAKAGKFYKNLFIFAIPKVLSELENLEPQQLANIAWSYSKIGLVSPHLFENLKRRSIKILDKFLPINISMLCYSFALADILPSNLFELVSNLDIEKFSPKAIVHIFWAFSITEFNSPRSWLYWICNIERISTLSLHELNLLLISLCLNYLEGFVQLKVNNPNDYMYINNCNKYKTNICKALAIRDRDPENSLIEWHDSINISGMIKVNNNINESNLPFDHELIWSTIDILIPRIVEKFRFYKDVFDIVWILSLIGKNVSSFIEKFDKGIFEYRSVMNRSSDSNSINDLVQNISSGNTSPYSSCCNNEFHQGTESLSNYELSSYFEVQTEHKQKFDKNLTLRKNYAEWDQDQERKEFEDLYNTVQSTDISKQNENSSNILIALVFLYNLVLVCLVIFK